MIYQTILSRIVELQAHTVIRKITDNQEEYEWLEELVESTKPNSPHDTPTNTAKRHYLIDTPFRYPLPIPPLFTARFRPPYFDKNAFYGTENDLTANYEYAYHWMRQRIHIQGLSQTPEPRTLFHVRFLDKACIDIRKHKDIATIMDRNDYAPSHSFIEANTDITSIIYPSCRDPQRGNCIVTFDPKTLGKNPLDTTHLYFIYHQEKKECVVEDVVKGTKLSISWESVC